MIIDEISEIKKYLQDITDRTDFDELMQSFNITFFIDDIKKLMYIKQFLRLVHLAVSKSFYMYDTIDELPIGLLGFNGTFTSSTKIKEVIKSILENHSCSLEDMTIIIGLYDDKSHIVGMLNNYVHKDEQPIIMHVEDAVSEFA